MSTPTPPDEPVHHGRAPAAEILQDLEQLLCHASHLCLFSAPAAPYEVCQGPPLHKLLRQLTEPV